MVKNMEACTRIIKIRTRGTRVYTIKSYTRRLKREDHHKLYYEGIY